MLLFTLLVLYSKKYMNCKSIFENYDILMAIVSFLTDEEMCALLFVSKFTYNLRKKYNVIEIRFLKY